MYNFYRGLDSSKVNNYITKLKGSKDILLEEDTIVVDYRASSIKDLESKAIELKRDQIAKKDVARLPRLY